MKAQGGAEFRASTAQRLATLADAGRQGEHAAAAAWLVRRCELLWSRGYFSKTRESDRSEKPWGVIVLSTLAADYLYGCAGHSSRCGCWPPPTAPAPAPLQVRGSALPVAAGPLPVASPARNHQPLTTCPAPLRTWSAFAAGWPRAPRRQRRCKSCCVRCSRCGMSRAWQGRGPQPSCGQRRHTLQPMPRQRGSSCMALMTRRLRCGRRGVSDGSASGPVPQRAGVCCQRAVRDCSACAAAAGLLLCKPLLAEHLC